MIYRIGNVTDLATIPIPNGKAFELLCHYARILTSEYGQERNVNEDDGGYVLYCPPGTRTEEIKDYFDYTEHCVESVDRFGHLFAATYILHNEFAVTIILSAEDAPAEILKEIDE